MSERRTSAFALRSFVASVQPSSALVERNPFFSPDHASVQGWASYLDGVRKSGSSCGAVVEIVAEGVPAGLGAPLYGKLD